MSVPVIKAICRRIEARMGGGKNAALAAGISGGLWSQYCSGDHPTITIPIHRLLEIAEGDERAAIVSLFTGDEVAPPPSSINAETESDETIESAAELHKMVRLATLDGDVTENEARPIRDKALETIGHAEGVLKAMG